MQNKCEGPPQSIEGDMATENLTLSNKESRILFSEQHSRPTSLIKTSLELDRIILDDIRRTQSLNKRANSDTVTVIVAKRHGLDPNVISIYLNDIIANGKIKNTIYRGKDSFRINF